MTATWLCTGGTLLRTEGGTIAVEHLAPGDAVRLHGGAWAAAAWIGRLRMSADELAARPALWPVRIAAGALAERYPPADTLVLPDCLVEVAGFVPAAAKWLVDGQRLSRPAPVAPLDIYSLMIDGPAAPDALCATDGEAAPRPEEAALFALRRHLAARAGMMPGALRGSVDALGADVVGGWIAEDADPSCKVAVEVVVDGIAMPPVLADRFRADLEAAGIGDGHHAFSVAVTPPLRRTGSHLLRVRRALDGADLPGSPALLEAAPGTVGGIAALLDGIGDIAALRPAAESALRILAARLDGAGSNPAGGGTSMRAAPMP